MRGYDRHQVDEHIRQDRSRKFRQHSEQAQAMAAGACPKAHRQFHEQERPRPIPASAPGSSSCCGLAEETGKPRWSRRLDRKPARSKATAEGRCRRAAGRRRETMLPELGRERQGARPANNRPATEREADSIRTTAPARGRRADLRDRGARAAKLRANGRPRGRREGSAHGPRVKSPSCGQAPSARSPQLKATG